MRLRLLFKGGLFLFVLSYAFCSIVQAAATFNLKGNGITAHGATGALTTPAGGVKFYSQTIKFDSNTGLPTGNVEIFASNPDTQGQLTPSISNGNLIFSENGTPLSQTEVGKQYVLFNDAAEGATIYILVWDTTVGKGGYYYIRSFTFPSGDGWKTFDPTTTWNISGQANNKAVAPAVPLITKFSDATTVIVGDGTEASIIAYSAAPTEADGSTIPISSYSWNYGPSNKMGLNGGAGQNMTIVNPPAGTYSFQVTYSNDFGSTLSNVESHPYAGAGAGGAQTYTLILKSGVDAGKPGINFISMPFASPWYVDGSEVVTAYDLVMAIKAAAGNVNVVSTFGRWDSTSQQKSGVNLPGNDPGTKGDKSIGDSLNAIALATGEGYQVYVTKPVTLTIKNTP